MKTKWNKVERGKVFPFGAFVRDGGTNFAVYSESASGIELCLFDSSSENIEAVIPLFGPSEFIYHVFVSGVCTGQRYAFRASGKNAPREGFFFDSNRILLDPYTRGVVVGEELDGNPSWVSCVCEHKFDWKNTSCPDVPWSSTLIYEAHVGGLTMNHPQVSPEKRGTYLGLSSEPMLRHFQNLGVTAVELLPIHARGNEPRLLRQGLTNFWGYNTAAFFAPDPRFATAASRKDPDAVLREFKEMVRTLHQVGIEVLLDVVYNHTAEGDVDGPIYSFRGLDNATYYRTVPGSPDRYEDFTGCGNTMNAAHPVVQKLILDSLRFWAGECQVDGFRFDLASAIARDANGNFQRENPVFGAIQQDPLLSRKKLIAESWDATPSGYQVGNFPRGISEWNGVFRDNVRRFWRGDAFAVPQLASAFSGTSTLFQDGGRTPRASVNFVTAHDGFTLYDLVSYSTKRNDVNGENGRDGTNDNFSSNHGIDGPSGDESIERMRIRSMKNLLATLFLSLGTPMILAGDEGARTQQGNNNAYNQDNEVSWVDWKRMDEHSDLTQFVSYLQMFRREQGPLFGASFLTGAIQTRTMLPDVLWLSESGDVLEGAAWNDESTKVLCIYSGPLELGGDSTLIFLNPAKVPAHFRISRHLLEKEWRLILRTDEITPFREPVTVRGETTLEVPAQTLMIFRGNPRDSSAVFSI